MALALIIIGIMMVTAGARGTAGALGNQVASDVGGSDGFVYWLIAIMLIGSLGYSARFRTFSNAFLALLFVAFIVKDKGGVFSQFQAALGSIQSDPNDSPSTTTSAASGSGSSTSNPFGDILGVASVIGDFF